MTGMLMVVRSVFARMLMIMQIRGPFVIMFMAVLVRVFMFVSVGMLMTVFLVLVRVLMVMCMRVPMSVLVLMVMFPFHKQILLFIIFVAM
jgi:hypothetical protein